MTCVTLSKMPQNPILSTFSKKIEGVLHILKNIKWFKENKVIVNADKFQVLLIDQRK